MRWGMIFHPRRLIYNVFKQISKQLQTLYTPFRMESIAKED